VGSFFIPLVNFYLPYRIVTDIWNGSRLAPAAGENVRRHAGMVPLVLAWWLVWMLARVINYLISMGGSAAPSDGPFRNPGRLLFTCLLGIAAHLLTFFVVRTIQNMQDRKWALSLPLAAAADDPGAPPAAPR
jgi:thiol:disulfide interchange protein